MNTTTLEATPTATDRVGSIAWKDQSGASHQHIADSGILDKELYRAARSRKGSNYRGRRNYNGFHWFAGTNDSVWYESLMERSALLLLDFANDIVSIATQPMLMRFPDGTRHFPDFIAKHADGRQVVYNVKPAAHINDKVRVQFANTAAMCAAVGWTHEVISLFDPVTTGNIEWVGNFRQDHFAPTAAQRIDFLSALHSPQPLRVAAELIGNAAWDARIAAVYHLAWQGDITLDLTTPLSNNSLVRRATS